MQVPIYVIRFRGKYHTVHNGSCCKAKLSQILSNNQRVIFLGEVQLISFHAMFMGWKTDNFTTNYLPMIIKHGNRKSPINGGL